MIWTHLVISSSISHLDSSGLNFPCSTIISLFRPTGWVFCRFIYVLSPICINISNLQDLHHQIQGPVRKSSVDQRFSAPHQTSLVRLTYQVGFGRAPNIKTFLPLRIISTTRFHLEHVLHTYAKAHDGQIKLGSWLANLTRPCSAPTSQDGLHRWR